MYKGLVILFLFSLTPISFGETPNVSEKCLDSLTQLLEGDMASRNKVKEFLSLQADLTMHKLAYSMYRNNLSKERFKIEDQILNLVNQMENLPPEVEEIKKKFEANPLSRYHLASIMPYLKDVINQQNFEEDPFKKKMFLIGENDLKLLSILAEGEIKKSNGMYDHRLFTNKNDNRSILNLLTIINSSIRNSTDIEDVEENLKKRLEDVQTEIVNLLDEIQMPSECQPLYSLCRETQADQGIINEDFLNIVLEASDRARGMYRYRYLKYGNAWLHTGSYERVTIKNGEVVPLEPVVVTTQPVPEEEEEVELPPADLTTQVQLTDEQIVEDYLVQHVLDHLAYFVDKETLENDSELLYSLARAIDAGILSETDMEKRVFQYKGEEYYLPEMWNASYANNRAVKKFRDKLNRYVRVPWNSFWSEDDEFKVPASIPETAIEDFKRLRDEQLHIFERKMSFEFRGELYDIQTGEKIEANKVGLLSFKKGPAQQRGNEVDTIPGEVTTQIAQAIKKGERSYIVDDEVFHISGEPVDPIREYQRANSAAMRIMAEANENATPTRYPSQQQVLDLEQNSPEVYSLVLKAMTDRKRSFVHQDKVYDLQSRKPFTPLSSSQTQAVGRTYRAQSGLSIRSDVGVDNASAILNDEVSYLVDGKRYSTMTGREISDDSPRIEIEDGFFQHDQIISYEAKINDQENQTILETYFKNNEDKKCDFHTVINKSRSVMEIYNKEGIKLSTIDVLIGPEGDKNQANQTPAGIIRTQKRTIASRAPIPFGKISEDQIDLLAKLNNDDPNDNRVTNGQILVPELYMDTYLDRYYDEDCPLFVLPDQEDLKFQLSDGMLEFGSKDQTLYTKSCEGSSKLCADDYNFSSIDEFKSRDISVAFEDEIISNEISRDFAKSLVENKKDLMEKLGLSNNEYNELVKMAVAVLGVESGFGTETAYNVKEFNFLGLDIGQYLVTQAKRSDDIDEAIFVGDGFLSDEHLSAINRDYNNSRGLTQIKNVREFLKDEYPDINEESLNEPENAAIATMFVLSRKYKYLEYIKSKHPAINEQNKYDYLYYIYSGSSHRLMTKNATPQINKKSREMMAYASKIQVLTK